MPVSASFVLINGDLGAEDDLIRTLKQVPNVVEVHMVYGVHDIIAKVQGWRYGNRKDDNYFEDQKTRKG